jgi:hypothetical protein
VEVQKLRGLGFVGVRCQYCDKSRHPGDVLRLPGGVTMCLNCADWHQHALKILSGDLPRGCQECGAKFFSLKRTPKARRDVEIVMRLVVKDGIYQVLCEPCAAAYRAKRKEFYRGTQFGDKLKI